jgi:hypothetical protein
MNGKLNVFHHDSEIIAHNFLDISVCAVCNPDGGQTHVLHGWDRSGRFDDLSFPFSVRHSADDWLSFVTA